MSAHAFVRTFRDIARHEVEQRMSVDIAQVTSTSSVDGTFTCGVQTRAMGLPLKAVPIAVGVLGFASLPEVGDLVVVVFAGGDIHSPVIVGRLYDDETKPPENKPGEMVLVRPQGTESGSSTLDVVLKAGDDGRSLKITLAGKVEAIVDEEKISLVAGDAELVLDSGGEATVKVGSDASLVLKKNGDVAIKGNKLSLKATEIEIAGDAKVKVTGQTLELN